ncbi:Protein of unknown function (DUF1676) [Homalodisca vitripennis]|nr:Protein of unknown function (DUF1676) [Homalodisca vitripennis]
MFKTERLYVQYTIKRKKQTIKKVARGRKKVQVTRIERVWGTSLACQTGRGHSDIRHLDNGMARVLWLVLILGGVLGNSNHIPGSSRGISSGDELVASVIDSCFDGDDPFSKCVKLHALSYLEHLSGSPGVSTQGEKRSLEDSHSEDESQLDDLVFERVKRVLRSHQFKVHLPEFFFQEATVTFNPAQEEFDVSFPAAPEGEARAYSEGRNSKPAAANQAGSQTQMQIPMALERNKPMEFLIPTRDMMKQKLLLPLLLLIKLKLKALTPILVALVGLKAMKALILSKISILLVIGFLAVQLFKKAGMMPMMPPMTMEPAAPPAYGPPAPAAPAPPVTMSSYEPSWEPAGGPYQRNWDTHQVVYSAYANTNPQPQVTQQSNPITS